MEEQIIKWMQEFVEQPNPKLGDWAPCPYARAARINGKIKIIQGEEPLRDISDIDWSQPYEVYVFWYPTYQYSGTEFETIAKNLNEELMSKNIVVLEDHPDLPEYVNGVHMNFGKSLLLVVQKLDELNEAADKLRKQGYYDHWGQSELDQVVTWRYK